MQTEEKQILLNNRFNVFKNRNQKEWWYAGISDASQNMYVSIAFCRIDLIDSLRIVLHSPNAQAQSFSWKGFLDKTVKPNELYLVYEGKKVQFSFTGSAEQGWQFSLHASGWKVDLAMQPQTPAFTQYDNMFSKTYSLIHWCQCAAQGVVAIEGKTVNIAKGLAYFDHCFGTIPRKSQWYWMFAQNEEFALVSLMNYGEYAQCYTQCYQKTNGQHVSANEWVRLDRNVSFQCCPQTKWQTPWQLTSPDVLVDFDILSHFEYREAIPPVIPFFIKINHTECFISAKGRVRVDGAWKNTGVMHGVLEEHFGWW